MYTFLLLSATPCIFGFCEGEILPGLGKVVFKTNLSLDLPFRCDFVCPDIYGLFNLETIETGPAGLTAPATSAHWADGTQACAPSTPPTTQICKLTL